MVAKSTTKTKKSSLPFKDLLTDSFNQTFKTFAATWWRFILLFLIVIGCFVILFLPVIIPSALGIISSIAPDSNWSIVFTIGLPIAVIIGLYLVITFQIGSLLLVQHAQTKKFKNLFTTLFKDTRSFFWRFIGLIFRNLWYLLWPIVATLVIALALFIAAISFGGTISPEFLTYFVAILLPVLLIITAILAINRGLRAQLAGPILLMKNKSSKDALDTSLQAVKGNWWSIFGVYCIFLVGFLFANLIVTLIPIAGDLISNFVLQPIAIIFGYVISQKVVKDKGLLKATKAKAKKSGHKRGIIVLILTIITLAFSLVKSQDPLVSSTLMQLVPLPETAESETSQPLLNFEEMFETEDANGNIEINFDSELELETLLNELDPLVIPEN